MGLVDTDVVLDVVQDDPAWAEWSQPQLEAWAARDELGINAVIYAALSIAYARIEELERAIDAARLRLLKSSESAESFRGLGAAPGHGRSAYRSVS